MPDGKYYDMGKEPSKMNDVGREDKKSYPCIYDVSAEEFPPLKDMKLGDTGEASIKFKIKGGGIEIIAMKYIGTSSSEKTEEGKPAKTKSSEPAGAGKSY